MKEIQLSKSMVTQVDDLDYEWLSKTRWFATKRGRVWYAARSIKCNDGTQKTIWMHREIMGITGLSNLFVDHINGNGLNNQRANIRLATKSQNSMNAPLRRNSKSGVKGVVWYKRDSLWETFITINGKKIHLGRFRDLAEAARVRAIAEQKYHGEYARR